MVSRNDSDKFYIHRHLTFDTVSKLVKYYLKSGSEIDEKTHAILKKSIERQSWELFRRQISLGEILGEGEFGAVHRGKLKRNNTMTPVAVKLHKARALTKEAIKDISNEARLLREFNHPNVVRFYGVSFEQVSYSVVD